MTIYAPWYCQLYMRDTEYYSQIYPQSIYLCLQTLHGHDNLLWLISRSNDCIGVNTQNILMTKIAVETPVLQFMM